MGPLLALGLLRGDKVVLSTILLISFSESGMEIDSSLSYQLHSLVKIGREGGGGIWLERCKGTGGGCGGDGAEER